MAILSRSDTSWLGRWWWTIDRLSLATILGLLFIGILLILASSPAVALRLNLNDFYFVKHQLVFIPAALLMMVVFSSFSPITLRRIAAFIFLGTIILLIATLIWGAEVKGARRWLSIGGFALQPSEFIKPTLVVMVAWMLSLYKKDVQFPGRLISLILMGLVVGLLLLQPDLGMTVVVISVCFVQLFLAGLPLIWVFLLGGGGVAGLLGAYWIFPHVQHRIDSFLNPDVGDKYQISLSMESFAAGGLFGQGPGEGTIKNRLPDAHSDFIFAVAGEEFGLFLCLFIIFLYGFLVIRGFYRLEREQNNFIVFATMGLLIMVVIQAMINMASVLHLIPTKGMTLPLISYGGSSLLSAAMTLGMVLGFTRKRYGKDYEI